jgi:hypothetical protein
MFATNTAAYAGSEYMKKTRKVKVVNDEDDPVPVTLQGQNLGCCPTVEPVTFTLDALDPINDRYIVPIGKRLHIKFVSIKAIKSEDYVDNDLSALIQIKPPGDVLQTVALLAPFAGPCSQVSSISGGVGWIYAQSVYVYAGDESTEVTSWIPTSGIMDWTVYVHGTLEAITP